MPWLAIFSMLAFMIGACTLCALFVLFLWTDAFKAPTFERKLPPWHDPQFCHRHRSRQRQS